MNGSLFLTPVAPDSQFRDSDAIANLLQQLQLTDAAYNDIWLCGEQFAQLVTFMGCSPYLVFAPPADGSDNFCYVRLHLHDDIQLITGSQTAPPRCPHCRHRYADWKDSLPGANSEFACPGCRQSLTPVQLDWRQSGGAGRFFIEIHNIFPGEAVPVDKLMDALHNLSDEPWRYFYTAG